jgi:hypothetical protein
MNVTLPAWASQRTRRRRIKVLFHGTLKLEGFVTAAKCDTACNADWVPDVLATRPED